MFWCGLDSSFIYWWNLSTPFDTELGSSSGSNYLNKGLSGIFLLLLWLLLLAILEPRISGMEDLNMLTPIPEGFFEALKVMVEGESFSITDIYLRAYEICWCLVWMQSGWGLLRKDCLISLLLFDNEISSCFGDRNWQSCGIWQSSGSCTSLMIFTLCYW